MSTRLERQVSFAAGELSPLLHGRTDLPQYRAGARTLLNYVVTPEGLPALRTGTQYITTIGSSAEARITQYTPDYDSSYLLLFIESEDKYLVINSDSDDPKFNPVIREFHDCSSMTRGTPERMRFVHNGGRLFVWVVHGDDGHFTRVMYIEENNGQIAFFNNDALPTPNGWDGRYDWEPLIRGVAHRPVLRYVDQTERASRVIEDAQHPSREWKWAVTRVLVLADGTLTETSIYVATGYIVVGNGTEADPDEIGDIPDKQPVYTDRPRTVYVESARGSTPVTERFDTVGATIHSTRLYRGRNGRYGLVGESTKYIIEDDGDLPDMSNPPPEDPPFNYSTGTQEVILYHNGRMFVMGARGEPRTIRGSALGDFRRWNEVLLGDDLAPIRVDLASQHDETIFWGISARDLFVFTRSAEWVVSGSGESAAITPLSVTARVVSRVGCMRHVPPIQVGNAVVFAKASNGRPAAIVPDGSGGYTTTDIAESARHLFDDSPVKMMAYADEPGKLLWVCLEDGTLLSCTFIPEKGMAAWAKHGLADGALVKDITVVRENNEDWLYLVTSSDWGNYIERLASSRNANYRNAVHLDRSTTYNGYSSETPVLADDYSYAGAIGNYIAVTLPGRNSLDTGKYIRIDDPDGNKPLYLHLSSHVSGDKFKAQIYDSLLPDWCWTSDAVVTLAAGFWVCATSVSGVGGFNPTEAVTAVADGRVYTGLTVVGGSVSIPDDEPAGIIHVGLPYNGDLEMLDLAGSRTKEKIVERATLELLHVAGGSVGTSFDSLQDVKRPADEDASEEPDLRRVDTEVIVKGKWGKRGRVVYRQSTPLPTTVIGITREYQVGG